MRCVIFFFLGVAALAISCKAQHKDKFSYKINEKQSWINAYKYEVFYGCIREGIGNDSLRIILQRKDLFNPYCDMDFSIIDDARKRGKQIIEKMPDAYIKIDKGEEHLKEKNFILNTCLMYYASRELDSIANAVYKKIFDKKK
ncbi:MAG TPA: hypothetical protein VFR70_07940 [Flavobacterium sp.]|nr:hypothetical protein [Flavobacterium sp.]